MSSPMTSTFGSSAMARRSPSLMAFAIVSCVIVAASSDSGAKPSR